eukprot:9463934-Pyramimonas_sp.AAC.1
MVLTDPGNRARRDGAQVIKPLDLLRSQFSPSFPADEFDAGQGEVTRTPSARCQQRSCATVYSVTAQQCDAGVRGDTFLSRLVSQGLDMDVKPLARHSTTGEFNSPPNYSLVRVYPSKSRVCRGATTP